MGDRPPVFSQKYFFAASKNGKKNWVSMKVAVRPRVKNNFSIFPLHFFFIFYS
jgi:hypothetical protein